MPRSHGTAFELPLISSLGNPRAGYQLLYFKTDGKLYRKTSAGVETEVGGSTSTPANMVTTDTTQTITGLKTFSEVPLLNLPQGQLASGQITAQSLRMWHDRLRFSTPTYEISADGNTWSLQAAPAGRAVFAGRSDNTVDILYGTPYVRWTWGPGSGFEGWTDIQRLVIKFGYTSPGSNLNVNVWSSTDGVVWTSRLSNWNIPTASANQWASNVSGHAGDTYYRLQVQFMTGGLSGTVTRINAIEFQTPRWGDQGSAPEREEPIWWNYQREVRFYNHLQPLTADALDLGATGQRFRDLYLSGNVTAGGQLLVKTNDARFSRYIDKAKQTLSGGGNVVVTDSSGTKNISWNSRFIALAGRGATLATAGYFDISMPPNGTVITGVGGAANHTVAGGVVGLPQWTALWYELPLGAGSASLPANFRVASYTADFTPPDNWVLVAFNNAEAGVYLGDGRYVQAGFTSHPSNPYQQYALASHTHSGLVTKLGGTNVLATSRTLTASAFSTNTYGNENGTGPYSSDGGATYDTESLIYLDRPVGSTNSIFRIYEVDTTGWWTFSFWYRRRAGVDVAFSVDVGDQNPTGHTATATWQKATVSANLTGIWSTTYRFVDIEIATAGTAIQIFEPQLERGSVASDYAPTLAELRNASQINAGTFDIARLPVAASGTSNTTQVVRADDSRLSNARTPTAHTHVKADITDFAHTHPATDLTATGRTTTNFLRGDNTWALPTKTDVGLGNVANVDTTNASNITTGTLPTSVLPALAINDTFTVASQAAMLALTAQRGDIAIRTDVSKTFILAAEGASTLANWVELPTPAGGVASVNGQTGVVVLAKGDVGLGNVDNTSDANKPVSTAQATAIGLKADKTTTISPGTGLTGGGDLSANRTLTVDFAASGTSSATQAVRADDSRLSNARTPTGHTHPATDLTATGRTTTNFLRGDNTWTFPTAADVGAVPTARTVSTSTGLTGGGDLSANRTLAVDFATSGTSSATQAVRADDSRLSNARTPTPHVHGISDLTATGTQSSSTFLRGDNTWATPSSSPIVPTQPGAPSSPVDGQLWYDDDDPGQIIGTETLGASIIDAKGDLIVGTAADTAVRLPVGQVMQNLRAEPGTTNGMYWETPSAIWVELATTANIALTGNLTIDGFSSNSRPILVKNQSTASENGIYLANPSGAWTRHPAFGSVAYTHSGLIAVAVLSGTANAGSKWVTTFKGSDTVGTTGMYWYKQKAVPEGFAALPDSIANSTSGASALFQGSGSTFSSYWQQVTTTDGFPINGILTGQTYAGATHVQLLQGTAANTLYMRYWNSGGAAWSAWTQVGGGGGASLSTANTWTATQTFTPAATTGVPAINKGLASQTGDLQQHQDSTGAVLSAVNSLGQYLEGGRRLAPLTSRLTAAATSTATAMANTGLSVSLTAGKVYKIEARGQYRTAATATGIGFHLGGTATATGVRYETTIYGLSATTYTHQALSSLSSNPAASTAVAAANTDYGWKIEGMIRVNAGGFLTVDFKSEVAASQVTVQPDCYLICTEVA